MTDLLDFSGPEAVAVRRRRFRWLPDAMAWLERGLARPAVQRRLIIPARQAG